MSARVEAVARSSGHEPFPKILEGLAALASVFFPNNPHEKPVRRVVERYMMSANLETLQSLSNNAAAVGWFKGLFNQGHIQMTDTGEQITVIHHGDRLEAVSGHLGENPNFVIPLESQNIQNLVAFFTDHEITEHEQYRIVKFMLQPCLKAALSMPILQNGVFRKAARLDTHWQEALLDPNGEEDEQITVLCVNDQWLVVPGYHGKPQRRLVMKPSQILDYQRRVFEANEKGGLTAWLDVAKWYLQWRDSVSVPV